MNLQHNVTELELDLLAEERAEECAFNAGWMQDDLSGCFYFSDAKNWRTIWSDAETWLDLCKEQGIDVK